MVNQNKYVAICGPLATGKTSLTNLMSKAFSWEPVYEDLSTNPYLEDYYKDNKRYGFQFVTTFLVNALELQDEIRNKLESTPVCQDWFFAEHHEIYAHLVFEKKIISLKDFKVFERFNKYLKKQMTTPDLLILLRARTSTILNRIDERNRNGEVNKVHEDYVNSLQKRYSIWKTGVSIPVLEIDTDQYDFVNNKNHLNEILKIIQTRLEHDN